MVAASMLFGNYMFDVKGEKGIIVLMHLTVFATVCSPPPNQPSNGLVHQDFLTSKSRALACKIATKSANAM